ncbi:phenylacetate--CoA ligase family protein [Winogradskyella litorisediminis]|uniref:Phenylacetate--CoA ligase family protein n=1 Tax=Winogradskyella litorisediminis TaxID=1156618 RepID=A0ABW3N4E2_9FLAO
MKLFDLTLKLKGFDIAKAQKHLSEIKKMEGAAFEAMIAQKKRAILDFHLTKNQFYKSIGKQIDINDWNSVPILTKKDLQKPLEHMLSNGFTKKNTHIGKTSGSSGDPFYFAKDKFCHALTWAQIIDRFSWYNIDFNTSKQARFYGIPLDKKGYYIERLKDVLANRFRFSVFDLSDTAFAKTVKKFRSNKFDYINGYTSSIVQFAKYLKRENIVLKTVCPTLKACIVTSEMLFDDDKKLMETQLGVPIVKEYGASELDLIAFENKQNDWQINSETLFVEIVDDNGNKLPYGEEGRIVITSFYNKAMPFIRYDIGDIGVLSKKSTIKKPVLEKLVGRTNDIAILPSGKKAAGLTFYYVTKSIMEDGSAVKEFVIEQLERHLFKINYVAEVPLKEQQKEAIVAETITYLEDGLTIEFERFETLNRQKSGKLKQFTSYVNS